MTSIARMIALDDAKARRKAKGKHQGAPKPNEGQLVPRLMKFPQGLWNQIDEVKRARRLSSRTATIRVLLAEAMAK